MNEDRDTRDRNGGSGVTEEGTEGSVGATDVWARAAEQALRDMARAEKQAAGRERTSVKTNIP